MRRNITIAERLRALSMSMTNAQISEKIGVSERSVRRWKNEGKQPKSARVIDRIKQSYSNERRRLARRARRAGTTLPAIPVPPQVKRLTRVDPRDVKKRVRSDTVSYDVRRFTDFDLYRLLQWLRDEGAMVRMVYQVPKGGTSLGGREYERKGRASTDWEADFEKFDDDMLQEWQQAVYPNTPLYVFAI